MFVCVMLFLRLCVSVWASVSVNASVMTSDLIESVGSDRRIKINYVFVLNCVPVTVCVRQGRLYVCFEVLSEVKLLNLYSK
jgi:hypothetical protein